MPFGSMLEKARGLAAKAKAQLTKVDDLERVALAAAGAIFADGRAEDSEYEAALKTIEGRFSGVFSRSQVDKALRKAASIFEAGKFSGRRAVFEAMTKVENKEEGEAIFAIVLDVADASGGIGDDEMPYIRELANKLHVNLASYGL